MSDNTEQTEVAGAGHNSAEFGQLLERQETYRAVVDRYLKERPELSNDDQAEKLNTFLNQLRQLWKDFEALRKAELKPVDDQRKAIQERFKTRQDAVQGYSNKLKPILERFHKKKEAELREQERIAREEAERKRREAEEAARAAEEKAKQAAAGDLGDAPDSIVDADEEAARKVMEAKEAEKAAKKAAKAKSTVKSRGEGGRSSGLRTVWSAEITDYDAALNHFKGDPAIRSALQNLVDSIARTPDKREQEYPGVKITSSKKV